MMQHGDFRTIEDYKTYEREVALPKLRWLQVRELKEKYPNDQEFGAEVRKLVNKTYNENN